MNQARYDTPSQRHYKYVAAVQNNGPNFFLVFAGSKTFGADPVCSCNHEGDAIRIVNALNKEADI